GRITAGNASGAADTAQAQRRWPGCACVHLLLHRAGERRSKEYMTVHFYDDAHEAFFREKLERAAASGRTPDNY
ncbi:Heavy metal transporter, partial [Dysosmobacter welbionis]